MVPPRHQEQGRRVALGLHSLDVVARVEPAARDVDACRAGDRHRADRDQVGREAELAKHPCPAVVQVRRLPAERARDHVGPVPLRPIELQGVREQRPEEILRISDLERRRGGGDGTLHRDRVGPGRRHAVEVDGVHVREPLAPPSEPLADRAGRHHGAPVGQDLERRAGRVGGRQEVGALGTVARIPDLVDAHEARLRPAGRLDRRTAGGRREDRDEPMATMTTRILSTRMPASSAGSDAIGKIPYYYVDPTLPWPRPPRQDSGEPARVRGEKRGPGRGRRGSRGRSGRRGAHRRPDAARGPRTRPSCRRRAG